MSRRARQGLPPAAARHRPLPNVQTFLLGRVSGALPLGHRAGGRSCLLLRSPEDPPPPAYLRMRQRDIRRTRRGEARGMWLQGVCVELCYGVHVHTSRSSANQTTRAVEYYHR